MVKSARCKKYLTICLISVLLFVALPLGSFAQGGASHDIYIHIPKIVYYKGGSGTAQSNWYVEYVTYHYEGYVFEDIDTEYQITVYQNNIFEYQSYDYSSETECTIYVVDAPTETKETYTFTSNSSVIRPSGVQLRQNGKIYPLQEEYMNVLPDGTTESAYSWTTRVLVEKGKSMYMNIWLYTPARHYNYEEETVTDEELIQQLLEQYGGMMNILDPEKAVSQFAVVISTITNGFPVINNILLSVFSIVLIGFLLFGRAK